MAACCTEQIKIIFVQMVTASSTVCNLPLSGIPCNRNNIFSSGTFWFFLKKNFVGHMSIFGATDTPVLDFW